MLIAVLGKMTEVGTVTKVPRSCKVFPPLCHAEALMNVGIIPDKAPTFETI
jgi:hypothetical protein